MQVIEWSVKWTGMEAANEVIWSIKGINAWLAQTYRLEKPSMTLLEFLPYLTLCSNMKKSLTNKFSIKQKLSRWSHPTPSPLVVMSNWSFFDCPNKHHETNGFPSRVFPPVITAQVITSCSTSLQLIVSVTDKATVLFSAERISKALFSPLFYLFTCLFCFVFDSLSVVKDLYDCMWGWRFWSNIPFSHFAPPLCCLLLVSPQDRIRFRRLG